MIEDPKGEGNDRILETTYIRLKKEDRKFFMKKGKGRRQFIANLIDLDAIRPAGCDCGHCRAGWDCCGRWFAMHNTVTVVGRHLRVTQTLGQNI